MMRAYAGLPRDVLQRVLQGGRADFAYAGLPASIRDALTESLRGGDALNARTQLNTDFGQRLVASVPKPPYLLVSGWRPHRAGRPADPGGDGRNRGAIP